MHREQAEIYFLADGNGEMERGKERGLAAEGERWSPNLWSVDLVDVVKWGLEGTYLYVCGSEAREGGRRNGGRG